MTASYSDRVAVINLVTGKAEYGIASAFARAGYATFVSCFDQFSEDEKNIFRPLGIGFVRGRRDDYNAVIKSIVSSVSRIDCLVNVLSTGHSLEPDVLRLTPEHFDQFGRALRDTIFFTQAVLGAALMTGDASPPLSVINVISSVSTAVEAAVCEATLSAFTQALAERLSGSPIAVYEIRCKSASMADVGFEFVGENNGTLEYTDGLGRLSVEIASGYLNVASGSIIDAAEHSVSALH